MGLMLKKYIGISEAFKRNPCDEGGGGKEGALGGPHCVVICLQYWASYHIELLSTRNTTPVAIEAVIFSPLLWARSWTALLLC